MVKDIEPTSGRGFLEYAPAPESASILHLRDSYGLFIDGEFVGVKPAGGIRASKDAIRYLVTVAETVGEHWLQPHLFRFGASSLLNDVLLQRQKLSTGRYSGPDYVTID